MWPRRQNYDPNHRSALPDQRGAGRRCRCDRSADARIPDLFSPTQNSWTAASLPLGAGVPDLVVVSYDPQVLALAHVDLTDAQILAYLRAVGKARLDTIAERMGTSPKKISGRLSSLVEAEAIATTANTFSLSPLWRQILPEIVSIEVKISKWQRAIEQAARNRIFAHRSFVALPQKVVERIRSEKVVPLFCVDSC